MDGDRQAEAEQTSTLHRVDDSRQEPAKCSQPIQLHRGKTKREREREIKIGREKKRDTRRNRERKRAQEREKVREMRERT